jgi:hypothetical protein
VFWQLIWKVRLTPIGSGAIRGEVKGGWNIMDAAIELYKELNEYQRHFNNIQAVYRNMASAWLLGALAGTGFVLGPANVDPLSVSPWSLLVLLGLAGTIGIIVLWRVDLLLYHELLRRVLDATDRLCGAGPDGRNVPLDLPELKFGGVRARNKISEFYLAGSLLMAGLAALGLVQRVFDSNDALKPRGLAFWALEALGFIALGILVVWILHTWRATRSEEENNAVRR